MKNCAQWTPFLPMKTGEYTVLLAGNVEYRPMRAWFDATPGVGWGDAPVVYCLIEA